MEAEVLRIGNRDVLIKLWEHSKPEATPVSVFSGGQAVGTIYVEIMEVEVRKK